MPAAPDPDQHRRAVVPDHPVVSVRQPDLDRAAAVDPGEDVGRPGHVGRLRVAAVEDPHHVVAGLRGVHVKGDRGGRSSAQAADVLVGVGGEAAEVGRCALGVDVPATAGHRGVRRGVAHRPGPVGRGGGAGAARGQDDLVGVHRGGPLRIGDDRGVMALTGGVDPGGAPGLVELIVRDVPGGRLPGRQGGAQRGGIDADIVDRSVQVRVGRVL